MAREISMSPSFIRRTSSSNKGINQKQPTPLAFFVVLLITTCIALPIILVLGLYSLIALSVLLLATLNARVVQREDAVKQVKKPLKSLPTPTVVAQATNELPQVANIKDSQELDEEINYLKKVTKPTKND